jgi:hypothetical protein
LGRKCILGDDFLSKDVKYFNACSHIVNNKTYDIELCPKCLGKGWYFDVYFDDSGEAITSSDEIKLQQEMLKVIIDHKYANLFNEKWGSQLHNFIGSKNNEITKNKIKLLARQAEEYLQKIQLTEYEENDTLNGKEIIQNIVSVDVKEVGPTGYLISILVQNSSGETYEQSIKI